MSVAGIDFGNLSLLIGQTAKGGIDVILNDSSNRQTATAVSIQGKQRFIGDAGAAMARSNVKNTISCMKLLVGRQYDDPDVQKELARANFDHCKLPSGGVGITISYNDEPKTISAEHFLAMMLTQAKKISAGANSGLNLADAVLAVPFWFTESQRKAILHACEIAEVNCLKIANESTLIGLSYGIFKSAKKLFSETEPQHVMFVDLGYTCYTVTIIDFIQENMRVIATLCDKDLGGRDFDNAIIEFFAEEFQKKTGINVRGKPKAILKLQAAAEKAKKTLSPAGVTEAKVSVECLAEDMDLNVTLTKDEFESRVTSLVAKFSGPIEKALADAKLTRKEISECEILGGSSRVNIVKRTLSEILELDASAVNYGLKTTMNADEAVARGGALQCAMVSSRMKVKPFNIVDKLPYGISASFQDEENPSQQTSVNLYTRGDEVPHKPRRLTFRNKSSDFSITISYDDEATQYLPPGESKFLGKYTIKYPPGTPPCDVRVTWNLDKNGLVHVYSAELMEELPPAPEAEAKSEGKEGESSKDAEGEAEGKESEAKEESKDVPPKKKYKKTELTVASEIPGLTTQDIKESLELEAAMALEDRLIIETADKRNELESYIYGMRDKMDGQLKGYASAKEKDELSSKLLQAEDWLYGEGFETSKQEYSQQLANLHIIGDPIELRYNETIARPPAIEALKKQLELCKVFASKYDDSVEHITEEERVKIRTAVQETENWMYDSIGKQGDLPPASDPILTGESIHKRRSELFKISNPIMTKPKPKPVPVPPPAEEKKSDEKASDEKAPPPPEDKSEPMDQAKDSPVENDAK